MILSRDVFSHGLRAGVRVSGHHSDHHRLPQRVLSAARSGIAAQVCVLVGALAAPVFSLIGWVGLVLPESTSLHQAAAGLLTCAMMGLGTALIGAHTSAPRPRPDQPTQ